MNQKGFANLIIIVAVIVAFSAIGATYLVSNKGKVNQPFARACTMEAKQCPDGSYVRRIGPACEFTACPSATTQSAEVGVINNFIAQWNVLQKSIPISPVLGSTTWQVDHFQFIGNNRLLIAFEDGHIMSAAVFGYDTNNNFNYINTFKDDYPFTFVKWQEIVKTYGSEQYTVATYVKQITRGTEIVNFNEWTKIPENVFLKQGEDLSASSTSLTADWKTYRNEQYGFEFKYPSTWIVREVADGLSFFKSPKTPESRIFEFALFYISTLNTNVIEGAPPYYVSPQEFFDYYYKSYITDKNDWRYNEKYIPNLQPINLNGIPVVRISWPVGGEGGDIRYLIYTDDREIGFVLYPGSKQNPTEYSLGDEAIIEQMIKTFSLDNPLKSFVEINL